MSFISVEMLNEQAAQLPVQGPDGGPDGSYLTPWRKEMLPPGQPDAFGTQRQIPTPGEVHIAQDAAGYRMYPKPVTESNDARQFPYEGNVPFEDLLLPIESYRTRAEAFKQIPYWDVKPVMGSNDWPSRKLFPGEPDMERINMIEQNIMPLPYTKDDHGGFTVMDIPMDFNPDADGYLAGLGDFGGLADDYGPTMGPTADVATNAVVQTVAANPQQASQPGVLDNLINAAAKIATTVVQQQVAKPPTPTATVTVPKVVIPTAPSAPFYTSPMFLALAALGLVGGGYMLLKK